MTGIVKFSFTYNNQKNKLKWKIDQQQDKLDPLYKLERNVNIFS
jgi:hypothetical protein